MRKYEARPGDHIQGATQEVVRLANLYNEPVSMVFNGIEVVANPGDSADSLYNQWSTKSDERSEAYRNSPEGKRAAREAEDRKNAMQSAIDNVMRRFETLDYSNLDQLISFFDDLADPSDHNGVSFDRRRVIDEFAAHGFVAGANCGDGFDENNRENFARYLIGQALDGLSQVGAVHHVYHRFASEWREKFAPAGSSC